MEAAGSPGHSVQSRTTVDDNTGRRYFGVLIQIPQIQSARIVDGSEERGMSRRPRYVVHVVAVVLERIQGFVLLETPELDRPVDGRGEE